MLSATTIFNPNYWLELANTKYYTQGGEPPGYYLGRGADALGYKGTVAKDELRDLMKGFGQDGEKLVQNAGEDRQQGYDFCFSAPKSVSVLYAAGDDQLQKQIREAQKQAVATAIGYLEDQALFTRRGKGGTEIERATAIGAAFEHITSRAEDPQLHTHVLLANVCVRRDGTSGTFYGRVIKDHEGKVTSWENPLFDHIKAAGAVYRLELAAKMQSLGFEVQRDRFSFKLKSVPEAAVDMYSTRTKEIDSFMEEHKLAGSHGSQLANLETKAKKQEVNRKELDIAWKEELREFGMDKVWAKELQELGNQIKELTGEQGKEPHYFTTKEIQEASTTLVQEQGAFRESELIEKLAVQSVATGRSYQELKTAIDTAIVGTELDGENKERSELVSLGVEKFQRLLTDRRHYQLEDKMCGLLSEHTKERSHKVAPQVLDNAIEKTEREESIRFNREYRNALSYLTTGLTKGRDVGATRVLIGDAGSGKTTLLATAKEAFENVGYRVVGAAIAGKAADELTQKSGIQSATVAKWFYELDKSTTSKAMDETKHHAWMTARTMEGRDWWHKEHPCSLDDKTVLVIDEAGMTDTPQLQTLYQKAVEAGALVIWSGDDKQCQAIGHGGFFSLAAQANEAARLTGNYRQVHEEDKELVRAAAAGDAVSVIENLFERDRLDISKDRDEAQNAVLRDWKEAGVRTPDEHQILVSTNEDRLALNQACQEERQNAVKRKLGVGLKNHEGQTIFRGDRVVIRENLMLKGQFQSGFEYVFEKAKELLTQERAGIERVRNGQAGTVIGINPLTKTYSLKMDDGRFISLPSEIRDESKKNIFGQYHTDIFGEHRKRKVEVSLGYAVTTHLSQGSEYKHTYVLTGGRMQNQELSYVQLSRGTHSTKLYATEKQAGMELSLRAREREARKNGSLEEANELQEKVQNARTTRGSKVEDSLLAKQLADSQKKSFAQVQLSEKQARELEEKERRIQEQQRAAALSQGFDRGLSL